MFGKAVIRTNCVSAITQARLQKQMKKLFVSRMNDGPLTKGEFDLPYFGQRLGESGFLKNEESEKMTGLNELLLK